MKCVVYNEIWLNKSKIDKKKKLIKMKTGFLFDLRVVFFFYCLPAARFSVH